MIALDTNQQRLNRAKSFGAENILNPMKVDNVVDAIKDLTNGLGAGSNPEVGKEAAWCVCLLVRRVASEGRMASCYLPVENKQARGEDG